MKIYDYSGRANISGDRIHQARTAQRLTEINYLLIYLYLSKLNQSKSKRSSHNSENCVLAV